MSRNRCFWRVALALFIAQAMTGCGPHPPQDQSQQQEAAKIKFRLDDIHADGLHGPPDGLRSVAYEFCVPAEERVYQEVRRIDPSVQIQPGGKGRIGCGKGQALCIGTTHQPRWRAVLEKLSSLPYIAEIRECFFE